VIVTAGSALIAPGRVATEEDVPAPNPFPRVSEETAVSLAARGVRASVVRLPQVHDRDKHGLVTYMIALAREKGISAFVSDGLNRWPAVHRLDAARLYRLAIEKAAPDKQASGARYHAVAEEGVPLREIADAIGRGLKAPVVSMSPEEAAKHFGFLAFFAGVDCPASSALTQERLGWRPTTRPGLIEDLDHASAFVA
jgi:nucleoside-diphosphate-sugar epimerase